MNISNVLNSPMKSQVSSALYALAQVVILMDKIGSIVKIFFSCKQVSISVWSVIRVVI